MAHKVAEIGAPRQGSFGIEPTDRFRCGDFNGLAGLAVGGTGDRQDAGPTFYGRGTGTRFVNAAIFRHLGGAVAIHFEVRDGVVAP